jgi:hypothetical protein
VGRIAVTFGVDGHATAARIEGPAMQGTEAARCVEAAFAKVQIPPFRGDQVTVHKTFHLD